LRSHDEENSLIFLALSCRCVNVLEDSRKAPDSTKHGVDDLRTVTALGSEGCHSRAPSLGKEQGAGTL
jgi:hypothetical protein